MSANCDSRAKLQLVAENVIFRQNYYFVYFKSEMKKYINIMNKYFITQI